MQPRGLRTHRRLATRLGLSLGQSLGQSLGAALVLAACGGSTRSVPVEDPGRFPGFPAPANAESVWSEATFFTDHGRALGRDLTHRGVLPVALRVGLRGPERGVSRLVEATLDPVLYLPDGTALPWVPADRVAERDPELRDRVAAAALQPSLIPAWDGAQARYLFFRFDPERIRLDGTRALVQEDGWIRPLDLLDSLVSFTVETEEGPRRLSVGVRGGRSDG